MTGKPKTLSLNTRQWRVLLHDNLDLLKTAVVGTETLNQEGLGQICAQLDDMKMLATAWFQVGVPAVPVAEPAAAAPQTNGVAEPKRRGWPKGKKRNAPGIVQAVQ